MEASSKEADYFERLPNEVVMHILEASDNLEALQSTVYTCRRVLAIFKAHAAPIVEALLERTIPVNIRVLMIAVIQIRARQFVCPNLQAAENRVGEGAKPQRLSPSPKLPNVLLKFLSLNAQIHSLSHLCLERCIKMCVDSRLLPMPEQSNGKWANHNFKPCQFEEENAILGFWMLQYNLQLQKELDLKRLEWDARDQVLLADINMVDNMFAPFESHLAATALDFVQNLRQELGELHYDDFYFFGEDAKKLQFRLPDPAKHAEGRTVDCPNLLSPNWRIDRGLGWPNVVESYSLRDYSAGSMLLKYFIEIHYHANLLRLPPQPFWKFGVFLWNNQTNEKLGLLPGDEIGKLFDGEDFDFVELLIDEYYDTWKGLLTEDEERWVVQEMYY